MTRRNRWHSRIEANIVGLLKLWLTTRRPMPGAVFSGEAGCRLRRNPDTTVGIDVCFVAQEIADHDSEDTTLIDGAPILAVEILSPTDKQEEVHDKVDEYLAAGVKLVWIVDPHLRTVLVLRPDALPELFNETQTLSGEPHLPGFAAPVVEVFA